MNAAPQAPLPDLLPERAFSADDVGPAGEAAKSPYPGLRPFRSDENELFFGREEDIERLGQKLAASHFVAVVGPSGCGKSSLVQAGLLPEVELGLLPGAEGDWRIAVMRPGVRPLAELAEALVRAADDRQPPPAASDRIRAVGQLYATLRRGSRGLIEAIAQTPLPAGTNLLILVDQFEEIFRYRCGASADEADAFVSLLLRTIAPDERAGLAFPVYVILTMRSDFIGLCNQFPGLPEAVSESQFLTPRMTRDQRRAAIVGPAHYGGGNIDPELVNRLLNDMGDDPDQLPIMQHVMMRMWARAAAGRDGGGAGEEGIALTVTDYESVGGWKKALSDHANEAFDTLDDGQQRIAEAMFRCLTAPGPDRTGVRRPVTVEEVARVAGAEMTQVIDVADRFRQPGRSFLTPSPEKTLRNDSVLDISHESLIRQWDRLREWTQAEAESAAIYRRLRDHALRWQAGDESPLQPPGLDNVLKWRADEHPTAAWAERYEGEFEIAMRCLDESSRQRMAREADVEAQRNELARERARADEKARTLSLVRLGAAALLLLFVAAVSLAIYALSERERANRLLRDSQSDLALMDIHRGTQDCQRGHVGEGICWFLEASRIAPPDDSRGQISRRLAGGWGQFADYRWSLDGRVIAGAAEPNGTGFLTVSDYGRSKHPNRKRVQLWERWSSGKPLAETVYDGEVRAAGFDRENRPCVAYLDGGADGNRTMTVHVYDRSLRESLSRNIGKHAQVVAFCQDGQRMFVGREGGEGEVWDVPSLTVQRTLPANLVLPDTSTGSETGENRGVAQEPPAGGGGSQGAGQTKVTFCAAAFSRDGKWIAASLRANAADSVSYQVHVWDVDSAVNPVDPRTHSYEITSVAVATDRERVLLAIGDSDGTAQVWKCALPQKTRSPADGRTRMRPAESEPWEPCGTVRMDGRVGSLAIGRRGDFAVAAGTACVTLLDLERGTTLTFPLPQASSIEAATLSPDDARLIAVGEVAKEGSVHWWDLSWRHAVASAKPPVGLFGVTAIAAHADGFLASGEAAVYILPSNAPSQSARSRSLGNLVKDGVPRLAAMNGNRIALVCTDNVVRVWGVDQSPLSGSIHPVRELGSEEENPVVVSAVAVSSDGMKIATGHLDGGLRLWDVGSGRVERTVRGHDDFVVTLAFPPDGHHLVSGGNDYKTRIWALDQGTDTFRSVSEIALNSCVNCVAVSRDGKTVVTGCNDGTARVWNAPALQPQEAPPLLHDGGVQAVAISGGGNLLATSTGAYVQLWDKSSGTPIGVPLFFPSDTVTVLAFSESEESLAVGTTSGRIVFWPRPSLSPEEPAAMRKWIDSKMSPHQRVRMGNEIPAKFWDILEEMTK